jgi:hypothetical protein
MEASGEERSGMSELATAAALAFQATEAIQQWCVEILTAVDRQLRLSGEASIKWMRPLGGAELEEPVWAGLGIGPKVTHWGANASPPGDSAYFLISFRLRRGKPWDLQIKWGRLEGVRRTKGQFKVLDIHRELMDAVNSSGAGQKSVSTRHASARATTKIRGLLEITDRAHIQQLAEEVAEDLASLG